MQSFNLAGLSAALPSVDTMAWVKSLNLVYGTKNPSENSHKCVEVEGDDLHFKLRCMENQERESRDYNGSVPNFVVASLSFVVSDRAHARGGHHARKVITIPIKYNELVSHVTTVYPFNEVTQNPKKYSRSSALRDDILQDSALSKHGDIVGYYNTGNNTFSDRYHHSERALWGVLRNPECLKRIVAALREKAYHLGVISAKMVKVYCAVLDFHSTRYLCHECEPSCFSFQKKAGKFSALLSQAISSCFTLSTKNGLTLLTRVSAEDEGNRARKLNQGHAEFWGQRDIRYIRHGNINLVLQRDDRTTEASKAVSEQFGLFVSSQRLNAPQPVFVARRRDNQTVALELTSSNKQFVQHLTENKQMGLDILKSVRQMQQTPALLPKCFTLIEQACQLAPNDIDVMIERYNLYARSDKFLELLDCGVQVYKHLLPAQDDRWRTARICLYEAYSNVVQLLADGKAAILDRLSEFERLFELTDSDCFQLYIIRALYFSNKGNVTAAIRDFDKCLAIMKVEHMPEYLQKDFTDVQQWVTGMRNMLST